MRVGVNLRPASIPDKLGGKFDPAELDHADCLKVALGALRIFGFDRLHALQTCR